MKERILIVEDELRLREILCDYFRAKGALPVPAEDGDDALRILDGQQFDALLLDIMMPGLDGFAVCRTVRHSARSPSFFSPPCVMTIISSLATSWAPTTM